MKLRNEIEEIIDANMHSATFETYSESLKRSANAIASRLVVDEEKLWNFLDNYMEAGYKLKTLPDFGINCEKLAEAISGGDIIKIKEK